MKEPSEATLRNDPETNCTACPQTVTHPWERPPAAADDDVPKAPDVPASSHAGAFVEDEDESEEEGHATEERPGARSGSSRDAQSRGAQGARWEASDDSDEADDGADPPAWVSHREQITATTEHACAPPFLTAVRTRQVRAITQPSARATAADDAAGGSHDQRGRGVRDDMAAARERERAAAAASEAQSRRIAEARRAAEDAERELMKQQEREAFAAAELAAGAHKAAVPPRSRAAPPGGAARAGEAWGS